MFGQKAPPHGEAGSPHGEAGQILLIVILVIIIASTVGLSLVSRSITSLRTSIEEAESQKALSAAEAGIERAIQEGVIVGDIGDIQDNLANNSSYSTEYTQVASSSFLINGGNLIPKDEGADIWIVGHDSDNNPIYSDAQSLPFINLYWGSSADGCEDAAIEAIVVSRDPSPPNEIKSYRYTYDSCEDRREDDDFGNNFGVAQSGSYDINGAIFTNRTSPGNNNDNDLAKNIKDIVFIRVVPVYKDAVVAVSACNHGGENCTDLPIQGYVIDSTGTSGDASRKLTVFKGYPQAYLPYVSYGLFVVN